MYMADPGKGGKGKKAPYDSTLVRVPLPLKPLVTSLIFAWRNQLGSILDTNGDSLRRQVESALATAYPTDLPVDKLSLAIEPINRLKPESERIRALQQENAQMRSELETAERLIGRRLLSMAHRHEQSQKKQECAIEQLADENSALYRQMNDLVLKAEEWADRAQDAEAKLDVLTAEITQLRELVQGDEQLNLPTDESGGYKILI